MSRIMRRPCFSTPLLTIGAAACAIAAAPAVDMLIERVTADLAARQNAPVEDIRTVSADAKVWRDTSMGCGKPTESHAQIDVEGFRIVLEYQGRRFDYRARNDGQFVLCPPALSNHRR